MIAVSDTSLREASRGHALLSKKRLGIVAPPHFGFNPRNCCPFVEQYASVRWTLYPLTLLTTDHTAL